MLDINLSTLLLQVANFLVMVFILTRFLFKPLKEMLDRRAAQVTKAMDEAERAAHEAERLRLGYEKKHANIDSEIAALKNEARIVIDETRQQMLQEAHQEINVMRTRAQEEIEQQRAEALRLHRNKIGDLVTMLTTSMLKDVLNPRLHQAYLDAFLDQLRYVQLDNHVPTNGEETIPAEVITAIPLTEENETQVTDILGEVVPHPIDLMYRVDSGLVAGAMVRLGDTLIDGSLQGQLQQLRTQYEAEIE